MFEPRRLVPDTARGKVARFCIKLFVGIQERAGRSKNIPGIVNVAIEHAEPKREMHPSSAIVLISDATDKQRRDLDGR
jgi:hypothetical protein